MKLCIHGASNAAWSIKSNDARSLPPLCDLARLLNHCAIYNNSKRCADIKANVPHIYPAHINDRIV